MKILRWLFFPISSLYGGIMLLRNWCFKIGWLPVYRSDLKVISVGNLSFGGTGKTPFVEFLIRELIDQQSVALLSRGYRRKTTGFVLADSQSDAQSIGDEPFQVWKKFGSHLTVAVDEKRASGLKALEQLPTRPEIVLMDDAFQHQYAFRDFNVLLTAYDDLFTNDFVLPTGNLREPRSGAKRADAIVITKCPEGLSPSDKKQLVNRMNRYVHPNEVFFSSIHYQATISINGNQMQEGEKEIAVISGIAQPKPFLEYLDRHEVVEHFKFPDHHQFTTTDLDQMNVNLSEKNIPIVTTEKDMVRLLTLQDHPLFKNRDLFYVPISFEIDRKSDFLNLLMTAIEGSKT